MLVSRCGARIGALLVAASGLMIAPTAFAGDVDDVMQVINQYGDLEGDLEAQAELIRDDRVMITSVRQSDQAENLAIQIADRNANEAVDGGKAKWITTIESPQVKVYGNVAVASFVRMFSIYPHEKAPVQAPPQWVTLVLVKERGQWGIAHTHVSPTSAN